MHDARVALKLDPQEALAWLSAQPGGATVLMATHALGSAVRCNAAPDALAKMERALAAARTSGATRALLWQADGFVPLGGVIAIGGATAPSRADALRVVDLLFVGLKGVAAREDVE